MIPREALVETAKQVYRSFGYAPIDTPALEYLEVLQGKGSDETDRQLYKFTDHGQREVGMRFDLTVPLARYVAEHSHALGMPFKRYHIATVWRGESPQRGRYREFMQCDFDTVGTLNVSADVETALVIHELMAAIGFNGFCIRVNNRQVLNGLLEQRGLSDRSVPLLRALDKLGKIGPVAVAKEMQEQAGATAEQAADVLQLADMSGGNDQILQRLERLVAGSEQGEAGVERLRQILRHVEEAGADSQRFQLDASIARGLDYYTGAIFEDVSG